MYGAVRQTVTFEKVRQGITRKGLCPVCGGKVSRSQTFAATVSPYNQKPDGTVRTKGEIIYQLAQEAEAWQPDFRHEKCR